MPFFSATTLAVTSLAATAVGTGVSAYGSIQAGKAANALAQYNAQQEEINAQARMRDAAIEANATRRRNRQIEGRLRAKQGASGVVGDVGSPLLDQINSRAELEMGALEVERQGNIEAGLMQQRAAIDRIEGKNAKRASYFNAAGTILKGAGSMASDAYTFKKNGDI